MTFEIQIEDSFDFDKQYVMCTASRRLAISSDQEVTPEVISAALQGTNVSLPSDCRIEDADYLDEEEERRGKAHNDLLERIVLVSSAILTAAPQIFQHQTADSIDFVRRFPAQPSFSYRSYMTTVRLPYVEVKGYTEASYEPRFIFVDRDVNGVTLIFGFSLNSASVTTPFRTGDVVNHVDITTSETGSRMHLDGKRHIDHTPSQNQH